VSRKGYLKFSVERVIASEDGGAGSRAGNPEMSSESSHLILPSHPTMITHVQTSLLSCNTLSTVYNDCRLLFTSLIAKSWSKDSQLAPYTVTPARLRLFLTALTPKKITKKRCEKIRRMPRSWTGFMCRLTNTVSSGYVHTATRSLVGLAHLLRQQQERSLADILRSLE
jgi:hypothetical protein